MVWRWSYRMHCNKEDVLCTCILFVAKCHSSFDICIVYYPSMSLNKSTKLSVICRIYWETLAKKRWILRGIVRFWHLKHPNLSRLMTKSTKWVCAQWRLRSAWASAQSDQSLCCPHEECLGPYLPIERTAKALIRLGGCLGWSESSLGKHSFCWFCHVTAHLYDSFKQFQWAKKWYMYLSHDTTKCVFGSFRPGQTQTSLRSHKS